MTSVDSILSASGNGAKVRPGTAGSRAAWQEPRKQELYEGDAKATPEQPVMFGDMGDMPTAMESEAFDKDGAVRVQQRLFNEKEEPKGILHSVMHSIRGIWMTKNMEDPNSTDRELYIKTTLRELIIYVVFLVTLCILTFGMTSSTMYYYTKVMTNLFVDNSDNFDKTFRGMTAPEDFWDFANGPLANGLYWEKWYNDANVSQNEQGYIFYENKLLGLPRVRQLRVSNSSCTVPDAFQREIKECFNQYSDLAEDTNTFGLGNGTAWQYQTSDSLDGKPYWGKISTYGGGGYVQDLEMTKADSLDIISTLKEYRWLDRGTRALFIDFTVYNANINLFCVIKLVMEFPATGGVVPSYSIRTVKLIRYVTTFDFFVLACEGIFCAFILYYLIEEILEFNKMRCAYFKNFWNIVDMFVIVISVFSIAFSVYRQIIVDQKLTDLLQNQGQYANFEFLSFAQTRFNDAVAIMVFCAWIKIFKYISFNKTMSQLSCTLSRCAKDVGGFAIMFFIFFFAYAQLGYLIFGTQIQDFSTFYDSVFTLLRTILGDFDFHSLEAANRVLGPIFFITYVFFVFFVLLNMFLAIINDTYAEVKAELALQKNEFELADYFRRGYDNVLRKLHLKKDKIVDIQSSLNMADMNNDKQVDFDEWRTQLKQRGYAEQEIEEMFARYDMDGDRVLDQSEQRQMNRELMGAKAAIDGEMRAARPGTAQSSFTDFEDDRTVSADGVNLSKRRGGRSPYGNIVSQEEFNVLGRRVDRMEHSIGSVVTKIDGVLLKLESMERIKMKHREEMAKIIDQSHKSHDAEDVKLRKMENSVLKELDRFDYDAGEDSLVSPSTQL